MPSPGVLSMFYRKYAALGGRQSPELLRLTLDLEAFYFPDEPPVALAAAS